MGRMIDANADVTAARVARVHKVAGMTARLAATVLARRAQRTPEALGRKVAAAVVVIGAEVTVAGKGKVVTNGPALAKILALPRHCRKSRSRSFPTTKASIHSLARLR